MRVMIVGATSTIGQRCAMCYRAKGYDLTLIGRTRSNLLRVKQELQKNKTGKKIAIHCVKFNDLYELERLCKTHLRDSNFEIVLLTQGFLPSDQKISSDVEYLEQSTLANVMSFVFFLNFCVKRMQLNGSGKIGVIGSITGDRGKKSTIFYSAAKSFLRITFKVCNTNSTPAPYQFL